MRNRPVLLGASKLFVATHFAEMPIFAFFAWSSGSWQGSVKRRPDAFLELPAAGYLYCQRVGRA
jgi:hypothetical protein